MPLQVSGRLAAERPKGSCASLSELLSGRDATAEESLLLSRVLEQRTRRQSISPLHLCCCPEVDAPSAGTCRLSGPRSAARARAWLSGGTFAGRSCLLTRSTLCRYSLSVSGGSLRQVRVVSAVVSKPCVCT